MRRLMIAALLITAVPAFADRGHDDHDRRDHDGPGHRHDDRHDDRYDRMARPVLMDEKDLTRDLEQLSRLLDDIAVAGPSKRKKLVAQARQKLDNLRRDVRQAPELDRRDWHPAVVVQQPAPPPQVVVIPASQTSSPRPGQPAPPPGQGTWQAPPQGAPMYAIGNPQLEQLKGAIRHEAFGRDRLRVLGSAVNSHYFAVAQVKQLLALFDFSNDRLQAVRLLRPRIMDMQNSYQLYESFQFSNEKTELKRILGQ